ncbi:MAG: tetratricopeptide repeat protein [Acidobacteriaceae bacterium]
MLLGGFLPGFAQQQQSVSLESLFAAAQRAQASGDYATAVSAYTQAAKQRPDMAVIWANLGLSQQEAGNIPAAMQALQRANHLDPSLYVPNLFLGIDYSHTGNPHQAIPFLIKAEQINPADAQAPLALGRSYISDREYPKAVPELDRALRLNPDLGTAWFDLGIAQLDQVEADALTVSQEDKQSPFAGALYAESLMKQARFAEAASLYKTLLDAPSQPPCLHSELGFALIRNHDEPEAGPAFAADRGAHPECSLALLGQARMDLDGGTTKDAVDLLGQLWQRDHGFFRCNAGALFDGMTAGQRSAFLAQWTETSHNPGPEQLREALLAALNGEDGCSEQAAAGDVDGGPNRPAQQAYAAGEFAACVHRLQAEPVAQSPAALRLLAACSFMTGDSRITARAAAALRTREPQSVEALYWSIRANERLAFQSLARFQQLEPDSARSHILLGDVYEQLERYDNAQAEYKEALAIAPANEAAMLGLANAYLNNYNPDGAMSLAQTALARDPDDPELNLVMAQGLMNRHEYAAAEPYLLKSLKAKPQMQPRIHALIGKVDAETGKTQEAIEELKLGASSDEDGSVQYLLAHLYLKQGNRKDAEEALARMETIKRQRASRGIKSVQDPDLSPIEWASANAGAP